MAMNYTEQGGNKTVIEGELVIEGTLTMKNATAQADSTATTVAGVVTDLNALLAKLRAAGILASE